MMKAKTLKSILLTAVILSGLPGLTQGSPLPPGKEDFISKITQRIDPGLYKGINSFGESCAVNIEKQARLYNNQPALSVLIISEKALNKEGKVTRLNAIARFVAIENKQSMLLEEKENSVGTFHIKNQFGKLANKNSLSLGELIIQKYDDSIKIEVIEETQNFFNKKKKIHCYLSF